MARLEQLIGDLRSGGQVDGEGGFTLDREKAREKMRQFQLADPRSYVLLLVQSAVLKGATEIRIEIDADDVHMRFDGRVFDGADAEELYSSLFGEQGGADHRARRELAMALNAAMALDPARARLESANAEGVGIRLTVRPDAPDEMETEVSGLAPGTHIHIKDKFRVRIFGRFFRKLEGTLEEEVFLKERCRFAETPIALDGQRISHGLRIQDALLQRPVAIPGGRGLAAFVAEGAATVDLLLNGVWIARHQLEHFPPGFRAIVDTSSLRKDVSQADVVRNAAYGEVVRRLRRASRSLLTALARHLSGLETTVEIADALPKAFFEAPRWLQEGIRECFVASGPAVIESGDRGPLAQALAGLAVWKTLGGVFRSSRELVAGNERVGYVTRGFDPPIPEAFGHLVLLEDGPWSPAFERVFGPRREDGTKHVLRSLDRARRRRRFEARRHPPHLGEGSYLVRHRFEHGATLGEVGLRRTGTRAAHFMVIKDGCVLWEIPSKDLPIGGLAAVVQADVEPTANYDRAHRDGALVDALSKVAQAIHLMMEEVVTRIDVNDRQMRDDLLAYLEICLHEGLERRLLELFGFKKGSIRRHLAGHEPHRLAPRVGEDLSCRRWSHVPLFSNAGGNRLSAVDIERRRCRSKEIRVVSLRRPSCATMTQLVLRLTTREERIVRAVFGDENVVAWDGVYMRTLRGQRRLEAPEDPIEPRGNCAVGPLAFELEGARVTIGLAMVRRRAVAAGCRARVRVLTGHRDVCDVELACPLAGVFAAVDIDDLETDEQWSALRGVSAKRRVERVVFAGLKRLLETVIRRLQRPVGEVPRHDRLALLAAAAVPTDAPEDPEIPLASLQSRILALEPEIESLPLLRTLDGYTSIGRVREEIACHGRALFVLDENLHEMPRAPDRLVLQVDGVERIYLGRILGGDAIEDGRAWLEEWAKRRAFEQRPELPSLALDHDAALVATPITDDGIEGQIGLPLRPPETASTSILVCRGRRPIAWISPELSVPLLGVVGNERFGVEPELDRVSGLDEATIARLCRRSSGRVWEALAEALADLPTERRCLAEAWAIHGLRSGASGTRAHPGRLCGGLGALASIPLLQTLGGQRVSFDDLRRAHAGGPVPYVGPGKDLPASDKPVVVVRGSNEREALESVFGQLLDYEKTLLERARVDQRRASAPDMPEPPRNALVTEAVDGGGLRGRLWIDPRGVEDARISFGSEGKVVVERSISELLPCSGAIEGPGVRVSSNWEQIDLRSRQHHVLRREILRMYEALADVYAEAAAGELDTSAQPLGERLRAFIDRLVEPDAVGRVLGLALRRMHAEAREGRRWSDTRYRKLYRRLSALPLLELSTGRRISLTVAERERPLELAHLELWEGAPEPDPTDEEAGTMAPDPTDEEAGTMALAGRIRGFVAGGGVGARASSEGAVEEAASRPRHARVPPPVESEMPVSSSSPGPGPPATPPTPETSLLDAIRAELRMVREDNRSLLDDAHLEAMRYGDDARKAAVFEEAGALVINRRHPIVQRAIACFELDPVWTSLVSSAVYTTLNAWLEEITDGDETSFHRLHAIHVLSAMPRARNA